MKNQFDPNEEFDPDADWRKDIPFGLGVMFALFAPFIGILIWFNYATG